ncbi:MAG: RNA polymerase sigma factor [Patescibacteria group bacterium]
MDDNGRDFQFLAAEDAALPENRAKDEDILRASLEEPAMFEMLVERYHEPLLRAAWRVVKQREEAEDIVQEAFLKMYKNAEKFQKYAGIEFKSWAYKVTINTAITHYRKLKRGEFSTEDPSVFQDAEGGVAEEKEIGTQMDARSAVAGVLDQMPGHLRRVLELYYFEDQSYQTIAAQEGMSIPTLKMRLFRAKKLFKKLTDESIYTS